MQDVLVIDNAISKSYQDHIENFILYNQNFPWYFNPSLTRPYDSSTLDTQDSYGWLHTFIDVDKGQNSSIADMLVPLAYEACNKVNMYCNRILNGRAFMLFPRDKNLENNNIWHIDIVNPHIVCLYYINDSTGPTVLSDSSYLEIGTTTVNGHLPIYKRIEPKKGRAIIFDGSRYHQATNPDFGRRAIINFNVEVNNKNYE